MRLRLTTIILFTFMCIALSYYSAHHHSGITLYQCLENPDSYDGQIVIGFHEPLVGEIYEDGFMLHQRKGASIRVYADTTGLLSDEYVSIKARYHKEGYLKAITVRIAKNRRLKIWFSTIPVFVLAFLFLKYFRFNLKKFQIELKENA